MIENLMELIAAAGLNSLDELCPQHINRRVNGNELSDYSRLYPCITDRCFLIGKHVPADWRPLFVTLQVFQSQQSVTFSRLRQQ